LLLDEEECEDEEDPDDAPDAPDTELDEPAERLEIVFVKPPNEPPRECPIEELKINKRNQHSIFPPSQINMQTALTLRHSRDLV
jgi:hypothetical protein